MNKTRMGKRAASLLLSLVMMLSLLPTAAYATMADDVDTQGASVSENGTGVSDDDNSSGDTDDLQVGGSSGSGTADDTTGAEGDADTTGAEGGADPADSVNGNDSADPQDDGDAVMPVATTVVSTSEELVAAIAAASDGDTITLGEGEFTTYGNTSPKKSLTFEGVGTNTVWTIGDLNQDAKGEGNGDCSFEGCETITFKNMTLKVDNKNYRGFIRINNTVVENCTLEGRTAYWGYETAKFVNATFNAPEGDYALWDYSTKAMTFEGCTFNISGKGVNVYVEAANADEGVTRTVAVNNCTVESTKENKAFLNIKNSTQSYDVTLSGTNTVNGLTANGTTGSALYQVETTEVTETTGKPVTVKQENKAGELETVYEVKKTEKAYVAEVNGVKYDSLQAAIDAASRNATVTMLADTRENVTISTNYLTLDLNGHTLNGGTVAGQPALTVQSRVTVKDSSEEQTGTIMREDTAENSGVSSHYVIDIQDGWLFFESGSVTNNSGVVGVKGASLVRVGDDSVAKYPGLTISGGTFTQDNFIVIKVDRGTFYLKEDGTLNSKNSYAVENWKFAEIKGGTVNGTVAAWTYSGGHNSDLTISGGTVNGNVLSVNYGSAEGKVAKVSITGGTVNGALDTRSYDPSTNELTSIDDATKATIAVTGGTFSSDPTKYVVEDSAINKNDDGTFGVAKAYLAKVGDTSYYTMDEAFKAQTASSEAIVLLRDYTTGSTFNSGSINRTVDLNGHTWTCTGTDANSAAFEINNPNATLTVKNGKVVSSQLVGLIPSAMGGTIKYDNSSLVFDGVEMTTNARSGIETNGNNTNDTVTLRNSTLNVPNGFGIYFPSSGTLTIDNSVINAKTMGVQVCSGSLNISGAGTAITVSGDGIDKTINDGAIEDGAAISIVNRAGYKGLSNIEVKGGTFTAKDGNAAVKAYNWENLTESGFTQNDKVSVSGGTFSSAVDKSLCADGYIPTQNADGTYGVKVGQYVAEVGTTKYETLQAAIAAAQDGQTVTLLADVEQNTQLAINKSITLGLNGKTIKNTVEIWGDDTNAILSIKGGAKVTITGNGTIAAKENDCYTINVVNGDLTIENGTFVGNISVVQVQKGSLTINGGDFSLLQKMTDGKGENRYLINCIDDAYVDGSAKVAISGGTFVGFDPNVSPEQKVDGKTPSFAAPGAGITKNEDGSFTAAADMTAQILDKDGNSVKAYGALADAVAAAQDGQTVTLLADAAEDVVISKSITLDLGGKTLTNTNAGKATISVKSGTVTVKNGNVVGGNDYYNIEAKKDANLTLTDVTATAGNTGSSMIDNYGTLTITSGTYNGGLDTVKNEPSAKLTITGGTFTLTKGTSKGFTGVVFNYGELTISGGEFIQSDKSAPYGQAQVIHTDKSGSAAPSTVITGGTFKNLCTKSTAWTVRATNAAAGATKVSGGAFNKSISEAYCAEGFIPTKNSDGTYGVEIGKFTVMVTSRTTGSDSPVANVAGGGSDITYAVGTKVTASAISGYKFVGWFVNEYTGTPYSTDLTCKVKPTDDWTMIAVYEPISGGVFALEVSASKFTVNGGATQRSYLLEKMPVGTQVTVVFKGSENFLYWVNESGKVVSTSKTYTFSMGSATTLKAVYAEKEEHQAMVVFISHTQQVISSKGYTDTQEIQFPEPPIKMGATFVRWSMTEAEIRAAMATTTTGIIVVEPVYEFSAGSYTVTVNYPNDETATYTATVGKITTVTAKSIDGKVFKCWKNGDTVLGYTETLKIAPRGDLTLTAEYVDAGTTVDRLPVIALTEISASQQGAKYAVSFTATRSVPDGYTVTEQGILVSTNSRYGQSDALDAMKLDANGAKPDDTFILKATNTDATGVTVLNGTVSAADRTVYGRAYMILHDSSGAMVYVYSDTILSGSYNSLTTNGGN